MYNQICMPVTHILIIFMLFIGMAVWYIHMNKKQDVNILDNIKNIITEIKHDEIKHDEIKHDEKDNEYIKQRQFLEKRDMDVLHNEFIAPEKRQPEHAYPYNYVKNQINIPTRGYPDNYHLMGVLLNTKTDIAFNLFGRQKYPGSNQWEYYVHGNINNTPIKLPLSINGDREIEDNQIIEIPGFDPLKREYKVKLYDYDAPRYNPFIY